MTSEFKPPATISHRNHVYEIGDFLGKGGFSRVYHATSQLSGAEYGCKIIPRSRLATPTQRRCLSYEVAFQRYTHHPNIVKTYNYFCSEEHVYLLLEFCENGSLSSLVKQRKRLRLRDALTYILQLIEAVEYLRSQKIIHRDIKLGNLLLNGQDTLKLCDFGFAISSNPDLLKRASTILHPIASSSSAQQTPVSDSSENLLCGTPNYFAPELLAARRARLPLPYGDATEIWAIGVVFYAMLAGQPPFETESLEETYKRIASIQFNALVVPEPYRSILHQIFVLDVQHRLSLLDFKSKLVSSIEIRNKELLSYEVPSIYIVKSVRSQHQQEKKQKFLGAYFLSNGVSGVYFQDSSHLYWRNSQCPIFYKPSSERSPLQEFKEMPKLDGSLLPAASQERFQKKIQILCTYASGVPMQPRGDDSIVLQSWIQRGMETTVTFSNGAREILHLQAGVCNILHDRTEDWIYDDRLERWSRRTQATV